MKMAGVDINAFSDHDKTGAHPDTGETIFFTPGGVIKGGSTWEPEQEASLRGGKTQLTRLKELFV